MRKSTGTSLRQTSGEEVQKQEKRIKVTITDDQDRIIIRFELHPWEFRSGKKGFWGSAKKIDWENRKYYQIQTYMIEIGSKTQNEPLAEPDAELTKQQ